MIEGRKLQMTGRLQDRIKIGGELSNLGLLRKILDEEAIRAGVTADYGLVALPDPRLEAVIALAASRHDPHLQIANRTL